MAAVQHASLSLLLQAGCAMLAVMFAPLAPAAWLVLALCIAAQVRTGRYLRDDRRVASRRPVVILSHAPGLLLSVWVLAIFAGVLGQRFAPIICLQLWTAAWTPLIELAPRGGYHSHYLWLVAALPWLQAAGVLRLAESDPR